MLLRGKRALLPMKELLDDVAVELLADELHVVVRDAVGLDVAAALHVAKLAQLSGGMVRGLRADMGEEVTVQAGCLAAIHPPDGPDWHYTPVLSASAEDSARYIEQDSDSSASDNLPPAAGGPAVSDCDILRSS